MSGYQRKGTFPSVDLAWDRAALVGLEAPPCGHHCSHDAIGLLDDVPVCLNCLELELEGRRPLGAVAKAEDAATYRRSMQIYEQQQRAAAERRYREAGGE